MTAERQRFPARADVLPRVCAFVERRCRRLGAGRQAALRLILVAEELFTNIVMHGYAGGSLRKVTFTLRDAGAEIELVAEDDAPAFDPFRRLAAAGAQTEAREPPVGGWGRRLIAGMSSRHHYERVGRRNRVTVGVRKHGVRSARTRKK